MPVPNSCAQEIYPIDSVQYTQLGHILAKMKFPVFSLCYINFPCDIFTQNLTISSMNKGHITIALLHTEAYKLIFLKCRQIDQLV